MKRIFTLAIITLFSSVSFGQTAFWTEDFGTGCNQGQLASAYSGTNGAWTVTDFTSGNNAANKFYVSAAEAGTGIGNCGDGCLNTPSLTNASLHVGAVEVVYQTITLVQNDMGASYNSGGIGSFGFLSATDLRAESPVIDCSGRSNVSLSINYMEGGQGIMDNAALIADFGSGWVLLEDLAKTSSSCLPQGTWTNYTRAIPAADGQSSVKIGFTWVNNDDGVGADPSFAVDDLTLFEDLTTGLTHETAENSIRISDLDGALEIAFADVDEEIFIVKGYDILGQEVASRVSNGSNRIKLETGSLSGVLILQIESSKGLSTRKIVLR